MATLLQMQDRRNRPTHTILRAPRQRRRHTHILCKEAAPLRPSTLTLLRAEDRRRRHTGTLNPLTTLGLQRAEDHVPRHTHTIRQEGMEDTRSPHTPTHLLTEDQQQRHTYTLRQEEDHRTAYTPTLRQLEGRQPRDSHSIDREKEPPEPLTCTVLRVESRGQHTRILCREKELRCRRVPMPTILLVEDHRQEERPLLRHRTHRRAHTGTLCPPSRITTTGLIITIIISLKY